MTAADPARLSVLINEDTQNALRHVAQRDGISMTEAVRRLIGYGAAVDTAIRDDSKKVIVRGLFREYELILTDDPKQRGAS